MRTFIKRSLALLLLLAAALLLCACGGKESADHPVSSKSTTTPANDSANAYKRAQEHLARSEYTQAAEAFTALGSYEDSSMLTMYSRACASAEAGDYDTAIAALRSMGDYKDCAMRVTYYRARQLETAAGKSDWETMCDAQAVYQQLPLFLDSTERIAALDEPIAAAKAAEYDAAVAAGNAGQYDTAIASFRHLGSYSDSSKRVTYYGIRKDEAALTGTTDQDMLIAVADRYSLMGEFLDSAARVASVTAQADAIVADKFEQVESLIAEGKHAEAETLLRAFGTYGRDAQLTTYVTVCKDEAALAGTKDQDALIAIAERYIALDEYRACAERASSVTAQADKVVAVKYKNVERMIARGRYADAEVILLNFGTYGNERIPAMYYAMGEHAEAAGNIAMAATAYRNAGGYDDSVRKLAALCSGRIAAGYAHTVGLRSDGTVVAVGSNTNGQCNVSEWRDIVAVSADSGSTAGLRADGTVVAIGYEEYGHCNVSGWRDIVAISMGMSHTVGLRSDGTVVAVGRNGDGQCNVSDWRDIVAIAAGGTHTVGLRADGTVVVAGSGEEGQNAVSGWRDIVAVAAGYSHTVGLRADGTVLAVGRNGNDQCNVTGWRDIVAIAASSCHTVGLRSDGQVFAVGLNHYGQTLVSSWRDITAIAADTFNTVGLCADGTVVVAGEGGSGQKHVSSWNLLD